jgi:enoyl-CoA hydratase/carnithine racemase
MTYEDIRVETRGHASWIVLARPKAMNAVRPRTYQELEHAFLAAEADRATRFVVLTGDGRGFCAGDTSTRSSRKRTTLAAREARRLVAGAARARPWSADLECTKPTIAAINGAAVGMGMDLALLCDMRIAARELGSYSAPRRDRSARTAAAAHDRPRAMELLLSGELIAAEEAERLGIVSRVVPDEDLHVAVEALLEKLSFGAPLAQRAIKRTVHKGLSMAWPELEEYGRMLSDELWRTEDHREGVRAHVEKRKPRWQER